jgi:dephospho-CoA kinase
LVHPAVALDFAQWLSDQDSPYVLKEVAILFETGGETQCDAVVLVTALKGQRLARVMARDGTTKPQIDQRMDLQWSDDVKKEKADFVIENNDLALALKQVTNVHKALMEAR